MKVETNATNENQFTAFDVSIRLTVESQEEYMNLARVNEELARDKYEIYDAEGLSPEVKQVVKSLLQAIFPPKKEKKKDK